MLKKHNKIIIFVFALLVLLAVLIFIVARASVNDYIDKANQATLKHAVENVDDKIRETQNITYQMSTSAYITPLRQCDNIFEKQAFIKALALQNWLPSFSAYNNDIAMNAIAFFTSNYVIMPNCGQDLDSFSLNISDAEFPAGYTRGDLLELILKYNKKFMPRMRYARYNSSGIDVIPYIIWVGNSAMERRIAAISFMNAQEIDEMLSQLLTTELGALCVLDENRKIIASSRELSPREIKHITGLSKDRNLRTYWLDTASPQWKCVLLSYGDEALLALGGFRMLVTVIAVTAIVLMIITALVLTEHNKTKLRSLVGLFADGESDSNNIYNTINRQVQLLLSDKQLMHARLEEQESVLKALAANRLLMGDSLAQSGALTELALLPQEKYCLSAILSLTCETEATDASFKKVKSLIKEAIRLFSPDIVTCDTSMSELALILYMPQEADDSKQAQTLTYLFDTISKITQDNSTFDVRMFAGAVHVGDGAVAESYSEARMALLNASITDEGKSIVRFSLTDNTNICYYYPPETEMRLINLIRSGNRFAVGKLVEELFDRNIVRQSIDYDMAVAFLLDFYGSVLKIQPDDGEVQKKRQEIMSLFKNNVRNIGTIEVQKAFINYIYMLTDSFSQEKKSHNQLLADKMLTYVNEHIGDYNLSLTTLADALNISGGYCSMFFKEQIGMTFSDFLLHARSEKARELILENHLSIAEIASAVGYSSSTAFGRAFKKHYGINPTQVREQAND